MVPAIEPLDVRRSSPTLELTGAQGNVVSMDDGASDFGVRGERSSCTLKVGDFNDGTAILFTLFTSSELQKASVV